MSNKKNKVSIITPTYNSESFISETIKSIINQSYENWELLITDDCSEDDTVETVKKFCNIDKRIKLFKLKKNSGAGKARNNSILNANGRFIAFCDSDDIWLEKKLEKQVNFLLKKNISFSFSSYYYCDENLKILGKISAVKNLTYNKILLNNYVGCLTAIYDSKKLGKLYMSEIRKRQDWTLWIKIMRKIGKTSVLSSPLALYRRRKDSLSKNIFSLLKYTWLIYHKELKFNYIKSIFYMCLYILNYLKKKIF